jgi:hypothetical protein
MGLFKREEAQKRSLEDMIKPIDEETIGDNETKSDNEKEAEVEETETIEENRDSKSVALSCFGAKEDRTEKWITKCTQVWYAIMSFFWFLVGALTFAPVIFISNKVNVLFKNKTKSLIASLIIWCAVIVLFIILFATRNTEGAKEIAQAVETQMQ